MTSLPSQKRTTDYSKFQMHITNRVVHDESGFKPRKDLLESMRKEGFWPQLPIICKKTANGKLLIIDGHNRFVTAMSLGIPVDYLAYDDSAISPVEFSRNQKTWKMDDYIAAYSHQDLDDYVEVNEFAERTGISRNAAACMFTNNLPSSGNASKLVKRGTMTIKCRDFPEKVGLIVIAIKKYADWAATSSCVSAIARCVLTEGFDHHQFISKLNKFNEYLKKQVGVDEYIAMFESIYNKHSKGDYFPLAAESRRCIRARSKFNKD